MEIFPQGIKMLNGLDPWLKISFFFLSWLILWSPLGIYLGKKLQWQFPNPLKIEQKIPLVISLYLIAPVILGIITQIDGESWFNYGLQWGGDLFYSLIFGMGLGIFGISLTFVGQFFGKWIQWYPENLSKIKESLLSVLILGLGISLIEELIFRGFLVYELAQNMPYWVGAGVASIIFALLHLIWDYQIALPQLPGLFLMGMVLVFARLADHGSIGLAWGLHTGWILTLTCIDSAQLISYNKKVSPWLIGFNEQPLAGISGLFCLVITGIILNFI
jgi:uncharacterized protein